MPRKPPAGFFRFRLFSAVLICGSLSLLAPFSVQAGVCEDLKGGPGDLDGDGLLKGGGDCDDSDAGLLTAPGEAAGLEALLPLPGLPHTFVWSGPAAPGGSAPVLYDALRSGNAGDFLTDPSAVCLEGADSDLTFSDAAILPPGKVDFFLVRALNGCGEGDLGSGQQGGLPLLRAGLTCDCAVLCDDSNTCTADACGGGGVCSNTPIEPVVQQPPDPAAVCVGSDVPFRVAAAGSGPLSYQWFQNGAPVGTNSPLLLLPAVPAAANGSAITVQVTDGCTSTVTIPAVLTVHPDVASCSGGLAGQEPPALAGRAGRLVDDDSMTMDSDSGTRAGWRGPRHKNVGGVHLHSGEYVYRRIDMTIPGVGLDLVWGLTYRSRESRQGRVGHQWVDTFDRRLEWEDPATRVNLLLHDGSTGRVDLYVPDPVGCWDSPGQFRRICPDPVVTTGLRLTTGSGAVYVFGGLNGSPAEGRILQVLDRNTNSLSMSYDPAGRLTVITDTLGRPTTLAYDAAGRVLSVSDFSGRVVTYDYYQPGEFGGEPGDLKSVSSPPVTGTPNGNDFPQGTTHLFTYTQGRVLGELNHNLLTIRDPEGHVFLRNVFTSAESPGDPRFDRLDRQQLTALSPDGTAIITYDRSLTYVAQVPALANNFAVSKTLVRDGAGNVSSSFFDPAGRLVMQHQHTGRAPDLVIPTGEVLNQPVNRLRATDPPLFETRFEYNPDSLLTRVLQHNQTDLQFLYDSASPDVRLRANLLSSTRLPGPLGGSQSSQTESWTYSTPFGTEVCAGMSEVCLRSSSSLSSWWGQGAGTPRIGRVFPKVEIHQTASGMAAGPGGTTTTMESVSFNYSKIAHQYETNNEKGAAVFPKIGGTKDVIATKYLDKASPKLMLAAAKGSPVMMAESWWGAGSGGGSGGSSASKSKKKGNIEYSWKVEEGEAGRVSPWKVEEGVGRALDWKVEEGTHGRVFPKVTIDLTSGATPARESVSFNYTKITRDYWEPSARYGGYMKLGDIKGESARAGGGYLKIGDIKGESARAGGGYLKIGDIKGESARAGGGDLNPGRGCVGCKVGSIEGEFLFMRFPSTHSDARGNVTALFYDPSGNLLQATQPLTTQGGGLPPQFISGQYQYDAAGRVVRHIDPDGREVAYAYYTAGPQTGYLESIVDDDTGLQLTHTFTYDAVGNLTSVTDPRGHATTLVRNAHNQVVRVVEPSSTGYETDFVRDSNGRVRRIDVLEPLYPFPQPYLNTRIDYDSLDRSVRVRMEEDEATDACVVNEYDYDANDRVTEVRLGSAMDGSQPGNAVQALYDERDLLFQVRGAPGTPPVSTRQLDYDGNGNVVTLREGLEDLAGPRVTTGTFDGYDRLVTETNPEGSVHTFDYDANDNVVSTRFDGETVEGVSGTNVRLAEQAALYDEMDRILQIDVAHFDVLTGTSILDGSSTLKVTYNPRSQVTRTEDDTGTVTSYAYDSAARLSQVTDAGGNTRVYGYDSSSNLVSGVDTDLPTLAGASPQVFTTVRTYDEMDRLVTVDDPLLHRTEYEYDARDNRVRVIDAAGNVSRHDYDGLSRLVRSEFDLTDNGLGSGTVVDTATASMDYDDSSRLIAATDLNGNTTQYQYDEFDRLVSVSSADGTSHSFVWDVQHDLVSYTDANGTTVQTLYDRLRRPAHSNMPLAAGISGTTFETYLYDGLGRLVEGQDDDSLVTFQYDSLSGTTRESVLSSGAPAPSVTVSDLDGDGRLDLVVSSAGRTYSAVYDALDRLTAVVEGPVGPVVTYDYIGPDRVLQQTLANGVVTDFQYDGEARMTRTTHTDLSGPVPRSLVDHAYAYDSMDNKTERSDVLAGGAFVRFEYDSLYRLVHSERGLPGATADIDYLLDREGNRASVTGGPDAGLYFMDAFIPPADFQMNQYTTTPRGTRLYDDNGNLNDFDGLQQFSYDYRNHLVQAIDPGGSEVHYQYDILGRRISRLTLSGPTLTPTHRWSYLLDTCLEEEDLAAGGSTSYLSAAGAHVRVEPVGGGSLYLLGDDLGSVVVVTDAAGVVVEQMEYGDFGRPAITDASGTPLPAPASGNPYLFRGNRYDPETELYYLGEGLYLDYFSGRATTRDQHLARGILLLNHNPWSRTTRMPPHRGHVTVLK